MVLVYAQVAVGGVCVPASLLDDGCMLLRSLRVCFSIPPEVSQILLCIATAEKDDVKTKHLFHEDIRTKGGGVYYK